MKQSPQMQKLEELLRSSVLVANGFMGTDSRRVMEIIDADKAELNKLGVTAEEVGARMREITETAIQALGTWARIDDRRQAKVDEARGAIACPWSHGQAFPKRVTTIRLVDGGKCLSWSDLNVHMIAAHGFFEGKGASFRIEPAEVVDVLF